MKLHLWVWYLLIKDVLLIAVLYYGSGQNAVLWWIAFSGLLNSYVAVNGVLHLEERGRT